LLIVCYGDDCASCNHGLIFLVIMPEAHAIQKQAICRKDVQLVNVDYTCIPIWNKNVMQYSILKQLVS